MRLKKYLPEFIAEIKEFQELDQVVSLEVNALRDKLQQLQDNQFIESANDEGLRRYEQMLGLAGIGNLETRRFNILNKYNSTIPFTMRWLNNMLNTTLGNGNFLIDMDHERYTLTISIVQAKEQFIEVLYQDLRKKIPANIALYINLLSSIEAEQYVGFQIRTADKINI